MAVRTKLALLKPTGPNPRLAGWLADHNSNELQRKIVERAMLDDGIQENPAGSNRGIRIDRYTEAAGLPVPKDKKTQEGWWWCAIWVGAVFRDCGALVPLDYPSCDAFLPHLAKDPVPGAAVLFGKQGNAVHIGIVASVKPFLTLEGNRGYSGITNNGQAVDLAPCNRKDILGYFHPRIK
jgi:hypothetical protein